MRNAVECARPPAGLVPSLQRHAAGAVGSRSGPGMEAHRGAGDPPSGTGGRTPPRLPQGYRWIAVRPGAAPPPRRGRRILGPDPALSDHSAVGTRRPLRPDRSAAGARRSGPSTRLVQAALMRRWLCWAPRHSSTWSAMHCCIINRTVLLNPWVAGAATWLGVAVSVIAMFMVVASAVVLTNWLIGRRAAAFAYRGQPDPRRVWAMCVGCLVPLVNLVWAPVFVIELADVEARVTLSAQADRGLVVRVGGQLRGLGLRDRHAASTRTLSASPTTP